MGAALALWLTACASDGTQAPTASSTIPAAARQYVIDPLRGYQGQGSAAVSDATIRELHQRLTRGESPSALAAEARVLLDAARADSVHADGTGVEPLTVVIAQADFLRGELRQALDGLAPIVERHPDYQPAALLAAHSAERLGQVITAYQYFLGLAPSSRLAQERAEELAPRAQEIVLNRFEDSLSRGRYDDAESELTQLRAWQGDELILLDVEARLWNAAGDYEAELEVIRRLAGEAPSPEVVRRHAELEVEVGEVRTGLDIFNTLAVDYPDDLEIADWQARAKFLWRLDLLPPAVQETSRLPELDRSQLASLLYWLFPVVRYTPVDQPPIAADILDHPQRTEILRVLDLELMGVDRNRHLFRPAAVAARQDALAALLQLMLDSEQPPACIASEVSVAAARRTTPWVCSRAASCGLLPSEADCLPSAAASGGEVLEMIRRVQDR